MTSCATIGPTICAAGMPDADLTARPSWIGLDLANAKDFAGYYYGTFTPAARTPLDDLAAEYYRRTEAYDRTVCTGPIGRDGILPATDQERRLIAINARAVLCDLHRRAECLGYDKKQFYEAMKNNDNHHQ